MDGVLKLHPQAYPQKLWISDTVRELLDEYPEANTRRLPNPTSRAKVRPFSVRGVSPVFSIIQAAGWPIWPLLLASVIAVALIIERAAALRRTKIVPPGLLQSAVANYRQHGISEDQLLRLEGSSPLGRVLSAGMRNAGSSREIMKEAIEEAGRGVAHELERFLTSLGTIASIAPLMGLFGTVVGMIEIFGSPTASGNNPQALAHGISVALYNTGFGLIIAIPAMIFYRHFRALVDGFLVEMEQEAVKLVEIMQGQRK